MSLRTRLTVAFLLVVLGPVLLGGVFIGTVADTFVSARAASKLDDASRSISSSIVSDCQEMRSSASLVGSLFDVEKSTLDSVVAKMAANNPVAAVKVTAADSDVLSRAGHEPSSDGVVSCHESSDTRANVITALHVRVEVQGADAEEYGAVEIWRPVDRDYVDHLANETNGVDITLADGRSDALTSLDSVQLAQTSLAATRRSGDVESVGVDSGYFARQVPATKNMPVPVVLTVESARIDALGPLLLTAAILATVVAIGSAALLSRSTTRPLAEVAAATEAIAQGDLSVRVPVQGSDELAALARTFNRMARETQGYVNALTASRDQLRGQLGVMGETLSSTLDLERILEVIVATARSATGARSGIVMLVDRNDPTKLVGNTSGMRKNDNLGHAEDTLGQVEIAIGEGLLGSVAADRQARRGRVGDTDTAVFVAHEPHGSTYIALPIVALPDTGVELVPHTDAGGLLGVLAIYDRYGADDFDEDDVSTLHTFASQAAVAIGNVLSHREAQRLSLTDPLTGLWNYRYLQVALGREIERAARFRRDAAVIALDLDRFKNINDTYGHLAGDVVLAEVARRMRNQIREVDLAFRYGGEEFVVLLPEAGEYGASVVAERLVGAVRERAIALPTAENGVTQTVSVTASLGVAVYPRHGTTGSAVLAAADDALYAAKANGRDTWRVAH